MLTVLNVYRDSIEWTSSGIVLSYALEDEDRLSQRVGNLSLLYEPTHIERPRGYFAACRLGLLQRREGSQLLWLNIAFDQLFQFTCPVPFRMRNKRMETGLGVDGKAGVHIRDIAFADFMNIVRRGFGGDEKIPYSLSQAVAGNVPYMEAAEDDDVAVTNHKTE